jgi:hypothetical protein
MAAARLVFLGAAKAGPESAISAAPAKMDKRTLGMKTP